MEKNNSLLRQTFVGMVLVGILGTSAAEELLVLECKFRNKSQDGLGRVWDEIRTESFQIDIRTGKVKSGGVAELVAKSSEASTSASSTKFIGMGQGDLVKNEYVMRQGSYEIDRMTGAYKARALIVWHTPLGGRILSQNEDNGECKVAQQKF